MNKFLECENCQFQSDDEDEFEIGYLPIAGDVIYCRECACCSACREIIKGLK